MNSIPVDAMAPKAQQRANPNPRFSLIETAQDAFAAEMSAQEPGMRGPLWNEAGARDVEGMRPQPLLRRQALDDPHLRSLAAPARSLPPERTEAFEAFCWIGAEAAPGLHIGADHEPSESRIGVTTTGSVDTDGGWSGLVVTQPPGSDGSAARLRAQIGGSTDFALSDDLRAAIRGNAAVTTDGGASAHADLSLTTGGGTGFGVAASAGPDGVAHEAHIRQQIGDGGTLSGHVIRPADDGETEWRLRYDATDFRAELYQRGDDWGAGVNLRARW